MLDITGQGQPLQKFGQVVGQGTQPELSLVVLEPTAGTLGPFHGILAILNPLFCCAAAVELARVL